MQRVAHFLGLRPYTDAELRRFGRTYKGSNHSSDHGLHDQCDRVGIREFFRGQTKQLMALLEQSWPETLDGWIPWTD